MTKDQIITMAREAGMFYQPQAGWIAELHHLERFAQLVSAAERERCAELCDEVVSHKGKRFFGELVSDGSAKQCAAAIRAMEN